MNSKNEISALIKLLEDPDLEIFEAVTTKLREIGREVIPELENAWKISPNPNLQDKLEGLIEDIQYQHVYQSLIDWVHGGGEDLLLGAYIISSVQFPELEFSELEKSINSISNDVLLEINNNHTALEKVRIMNHILFGVHKFSGNFTNYYSPFNNYINYVIDNKKGNPISLSIVYSVIGQKLGLPIYGVNLPKNYILAFKNMEFTEGDDQVVFYINPYNKGSVLGKREIDYFLKQQNIDADPSYYLPCSNIMTIKRLITNLIFSYEKTGNAEKVTFFNKLIKLFD